MKASHKREILLLVILMVMFQAFFVIAFINLKRELPVFGLNIPYRIEDYIIITLSFLSIVRIFWTLLKH
ncbi:hypothetical protein GF323_02760 [Candidatus Woesearchaeota archaeon]|nr:hypothetical protein [Candidatus Woesearchaeota archaeon]